MTTYKLRKQEPKEGEEKTEVNHTYKFINGEWREMHYKDTDSYEYWSEYDEKGNEIHYRTSEGYEYWSEYDEKGNEIHYRTSEGYEYWSEYDEKGNKIHYRNSKGYEYWSEYDENGEKCITKILIVMNSGKITKEIKLLKKNLRKFGRR